MSTKLSAKDLFERILQKGDFDDIITLYEMAMADADAQFCLGICFTEGYGVAQDQEIAVKYFQVAADQGDAEAQNVLKCIA